jgi:Flp pilus assembly protein TadD, contains TPR repeats
LLIKENRYKEAVRELRICVKLSPTNAAVHNNLGVIFFSQNYLEEAEKEFKQASDLDPANKTFLRNLQSVRTASKAPPALG